MTPTQAEQFAELRHAGWVFTHGPGYVIASSLEHGSVTVRCRDEARRIPAVLDAAYALVGNPWGGLTPQPAGPVGVVRTRGTNPGFRGHGKPVDP